MYPLHYFLLGHDNVPNLYCYTLCRRIARLAFLYNSIYLIRMSRRSYVHNYFILFLLFSITSIYVCLFAPHYSDEVFANILILKGNQKHYENHFVTDVERQRKLNHWLDTLYDRQCRIPEANTVVIFRLHEGGGFGNVIRGYISSMLLVILFDTAFKGMPIRYLEC